MNVTQEKEYIAKTFGVGFSTLSASYLRLETLLGTSDTVQFNVQENLGTVIATEQRLKQSDQFIITHVSFAIKKIASSTPTAAQQAIAILYTWVNSNTGLFDGTNDANIQGIYNGSLQFDINRKTLIPQIQMRCFERVPEDQQGQPLAAIAGPVLYSLKRDSLPNGLFGYFQTDYIRFNGYDNIQPQINLPASVNMAEASESNYAVLLFNGYLASNQGAAGIESGYAKRMEQAAA